MRVLIGCEFSGTVAQAFRDKGHDAWSCDLLPSTLCQNPDHVKGEGDCCGHHIGNVLDLLVPDAWDLAIFHPPCTYLTVSGLHWNGRIAGRSLQTEAAVEFVRALLNAPIPRIALENPVGLLSSRIRKPDQIIQPYQFGDDASKKTCLWLKGLRPLEIDPAKFCKGRIVGEDKRGRTIVRWANQTDSGQNRLGPSEDRWKLRSLTYPGIARAMAETWGAL